MRRQAPLTALTLASLVAGAVDVGCARKDPTVNASTWPDAGVIVTADAEVAPSASAAQPTRLPFRPQIDGRDFPDHVIALTWDDGPDVNTEALATYLRAEKIRATFFVVAKWVPGTSDDPGTVGPGARTLSAEAANLLLPKMIALGHRLGNHTLNHAILTKNDAATVRDQLAANQERLDAYETNELRLFRVPGGAWDEAASNVVAGDLSLHSLTGPVRWDVDRKDWDNSLACDSTTPEVECERAPSQDGGAPKLRTKATVIARRYMDAIREANHGIVLLHDRVGDVGSTYALDLAHALIPLVTAHSPLGPKGNRYIFTAPVLAFSPLSSRVVAEDAGAPSVPHAGTLHFVDADRDGRADLCGIYVSGDPTSEHCLRAVETTMPDHTQRAMFQGALLEPAIRAKPTRPDVDGDGKYDPCTVEAGRIMCESSVSVQKQNRLDWSDAFADADLVRFGDINGDGMDDVCARAKGAVRCALSDGMQLLRPTEWVTAAASPEIAAANDLALGDVNGDGRADICISDGRDVRCGMAP